MIGRAGPETGSPAEGTPGHGHNYDLIPYALAAVAAPDSWTAAETQRISRTLATVPPRRRTDEPTWADRSNSPARRRQWPPVVGPLMVVIRFRAAGVLSDPP